MIRLLVILLLMNCVPACVKYDAHRDAELVNADRSFNEKKYGEAVSAYDAIARDAPGSERGADALFRSAFTMAYYDNRQKDYARALQEFDEFLRVYPNNEKAPDAQNWRYMLQMVLDLKKENGRLLQSINKLKQIDIRHEERRKAK